MASVSKRLATDETLMLLVDAVNNTETVKQAKAEIQAEGTAQVNNVKSTAEEMVKDINQVPKNTSDIAELNSNLVGLEYGEVAGGKNLFDGEFINTVIVPGSNYTQRNLKEEFESTNNANNRKYTTFGGYFKKGTYTFSYTNDAWFSLNRTAIAGTICYASSVQVRKSHTWTQNVDGFTYFGIEGDNSETGTEDTAFSITPDIMIEKGSTATTRYEPYIPSVKMLADEVSAQNDSLEEQGLLNKFDGDLLVGSVYASSDGSLTTNYTYVCNRNKIYCYENDIVHIRTKNTAQIIALYYNENEYISYEIVNSNQYDFIVPSGTTYMNFDIQDNTLSPSDIHIYINNEIEQLKNDLSWKLLADNVAVGTSTNIVSGAREYYVVAKYGTINITTLIPSIVFGKTIFDGYYASASDNARIQINTTTSALNLVSFIYGGSVKDDATYSVYYR